MPTMAEQMGLRPVSMAEAAGLTPVAAPPQVDPNSPGNQALIARRQKEAEASASFKRDLAQETQPGVMARIGRGFLDVGQGIGQAVTNLEDHLPKPEPQIWDPATHKFVPQDIGPADPSGAEYTKAVNAERAQYDKSRADAGEVGPDWARIFGGAVATAPAALVAPEVAGPTWLTRAIGGGTAGALGGAAQFAPTNSVAERAKNAVVGGAAGAIAAPIVGGVADKAGQAYQAVAGRVRGAGELTQPSTVDDIIKRVPEIANVPQEAQGSLIAEAQAQLKQTGQLNAEQLARKANLLAQGGVDANGKPIFVTPTKSMVTRDAADWTKERNLQKLSQSPDESLSGPGRELTDIYNSNDKAFTAALAKQAKGLPQGTQEAHGMAAMKSVDDLAKLSQEDVTKVYNDVRAAHGNELASDAKNVTDTLAHPDVADNAYSEPIINSVTKRLKRYGMIDDEGKPTTNTMTVTQADEFRKFLGTLKSGDPKTDRIVTMLIKANDQDVLTGASSTTSGPAAGYTRLYRGEPEGNLDASDRWFHKQKNVADWYANQAEGGHVTYVDVPNESVGDYASTDANHRFYNEDTKPYLLPKEIASQRRPLSSPGTDVMAPARQAARARFASLENPATQRALNAYGELNQGKTAQNFIQTNVINGADQDVASLLDTLGKLPPDKAKAATDSIKAGVIRHLQDKALNENSGQFSGAKLNSALNDIGDVKLARIFGVKSAEELRNLARAGLDATYQPPFSAVNNSNTAPMLLSLTRGARSLPGVPLVVSDEAQKTAARLGYSAQLKDIRAAQSQAPKPEVPDILKQIAGLLPRTAGPIGAGVASQNSRR